MFAVNSYLHVKDSYSSGNCSFSQLTSFSPETPLLVPKTWLWASAFHQSNIQHAEDTLQRGHDWVCGCVMPSFNLGGNWVSASRAGVCPHDVWKSSGWSQVMFNKQPPYYPTFAHCQQKALFLTVSRRFSSRSTIKKNIINILSEQNLTN